MIQLCYIGVVVTPDSDIEVTTLRTGSIYTQVLRYDQGRLPAGVRERNTYLPKQSGGGPIDPAEFRRLVTTGEKVRDRHQRRQDQGRGAGTAVAGEEPERGHRAVLGHVSLRRRPTR